MLWWLSDDQQLGTTCLTELQAADELFCSAATPWELGIKKALGKLSYPDDVIDALRTSGISPLPIEPSQGEAAAALPPHHRDPFDSILIAQAIDLSLVIATADNAFASYDVRVLDARR